MSETRFNARRAGLAAAAVAALTLGAAPFALAQDSSEGKASADLIAGSASSEGEGEGEEGSALLDPQSLTGGEDSENGSLDSLSADPSKKSCELPSLAGSVDVLLPYVGLSIPGFVKDLFINGLDSTDNPLEAIGVNLSELGIGSLEGPICSVLLGGKMTTNTTTSAEPTTSTSANEGEGNDT